MLSNGDSYKSVEIVAVRLVRVLRNSLEHVGFFTLILGLWLGFCSTFVAEANCVSLPCS